VEFSRHLAGQYSIIAIAEVDDYSQKPANERMIIEVMIIIKDFPARLLSYLKIIKGKPVFFFAVDRWVFERDIDRGLLGEAIASKLIFPYRAFEGEAYLGQRERELKRRLVIELLENLVINFPELIQRIQIQPKYFMYEVFSSRIRVFPLLNYDIVDLTSCLVQNEQQILEGYNIALRQLEAEGKINQQDGYVIVTKKFIDTCKNPTKRIVNLAKNMPRTLFTSIFGVVPQLMSVVTQNTETFLKTQKISWLRQQDQPCHFIDPQNYVFFPTAEGLVSLSDKIDIKGYAKRLILKDPNLEVEVEPIGGMLNDVYLIKAGEKKILAKRFKDWSGFKWFPLSLWSFGARSFAVAGQARLAKECAISEILHNDGFNVPKLYYVSNAERLVFMEFIEGESLAKIIKQYGLLADEVVEADVIGTVSCVGETMARIHNHNVVLGDTKPDNVLIKPDGTIFLIDFEQAQQSGDNAWDIAVFLYYCGHYLQPFDSNLKAEAIANAFITGYFQGGGNIEDIRKAGSPKYRRVFSIFTMPSIMIAISKRLQKAEAKDVI
jgi:tRNA A-37 threonylcarbamoyl transferase component Bud32